MNGMVFHKVALLSVCWLLGLFMLPHVHANPGKLALSIIEQNCVTCHGGVEVNADIDFKLIRNTRQLRADPELIDRIVNAVSDNTMPPEGESLLDEQTRDDLIESLKAVLRQIEFERSGSKAAIMRLNRFQYNNTVKDLFQLDLGVFALPEKLMTRYDSYLSGNVVTVPDNVRVASLALRPSPGLRNVKSFPKDSRASHGFDNQINKLTMSPLLLDAFLRLSVSIVESPDFTPEHVGVWDELFSAETDGVDLQKIVEGRLSVFLPRAFRSPVDDETLSRYTTYTLGQVARGLSLTDSMKKTVSAILSSPRFFYLIRSNSLAGLQFEMASTLSYILWGSCPDDSLLELAEQGKLADENVLRLTIVRMMSDPKIERFIDSFPSQWMQLESLMAITPDPSVNRYFSLDREYPAAVQMVLEPLLLFDALYVENRPIGEFISPAFSYRSSFLQSWYEDRLVPLPINEIAINKENDSRAKAISVEQIAIDLVLKEIAIVESSILNPIASGVVNVDLSAGQVAWEKSQLEAIAEDVILSPWHRIGPFGAANLNEAHDTAFIDESAVDLDRQYDELTWTPAEDLTDGKVHMLQGANSATYLYRSVKIKTACSLEVSLGSDDSFKIWLNGILVGQKKMIRGVAPDQDKFRMELAAGENNILFKIGNENGGYGFYFKAKKIPLPQPVIDALNVGTEKRSKELQDLLSKYYVGIAPELRDVRRVLHLKKDELTRKSQQAQESLNKLPQPKSIGEHRMDAQRAFDQQIRNQLRSQVFTRVATVDPRYGGVITNAAMLSMTSGPKRTHPVARGVWITEVIFNDPPTPPPNDIPPLNEDAGPENLTIRERFAAHRENVSCAGCHSKLDPLGFALENFDVTGRWRDKYTNGRDVDATGTLMRTHGFDGIVDFKESLVIENNRFARAFVSHLLRFSLARELRPQDSLVIDEIIDRTKADNHRLRAIIEEVVYRAVQ